MGRSGFVALLSSVLVAAVASCTPRPAAPARPGGDGPSSRAVVESPPASGPWLPFRVLYLARHGQTEMNRRSQISGASRDDPLDPLGYKHRIGLFILLRDVAIGGVFVSTLVRTQQTAQLVAAHRKLPLLKHADLDEFSGGINEGICDSLLGKRSAKAGASECDLTSDDPLVKQAEALVRAERRRSFQVGISYRAPGGGESILDVAARLRHFLGTVPRRLRDQEVLVVGHSGTNRFLLALVMGWPLLDALSIRQDHLNMFRVERRGPGQAPELKVHVDGQWRTCAEPPTMLGGLPCLRRPRPAAPPPEDPAARDRTEAPARGWFAVPEADREAAFAPLGCKPTGGMQELKGQLTVAVPPAGRVGKAFRGEQLRAEDGQVYNLSYGPRASLASFVGQRVRALGRPCLKAGQAVAGPHFALEAIRKADAPQR
jgi:probable phosphoglycerate mutase